MSSSATDSAAPKKKIAPEDAFLWFVRFLKLLSVLTLLFNIAAYIILIVVGCNKHNGATALEKAFLVLACVGLVIFSVALAVAEFSPKWFIEQVHVLHFWAGRGFFILWMGIQLVNNVKTLAAAAAFVNAVDHSGSGTPSSSSNEALGSFMNVFGTVVGWIMIGVGATYVLMSVLCLRRCLPESHRGDDLQVALLDGSEAAPAVVAASPSAPSSAPLAATADTALIANMALALGMTPDDARFKLGGSKGRAEAERIAKEQKAAASRAQQQQQQQQSFDSGSANSNNASIASRPASSAAPAASTAPTATAPTATAAAGSGKSQASFAAPSQASSGSNPFEDTSGRKRLDDDDELERAYYASHTKQ